MRKTLKTENMTFWNISWLGGPNFQAIQAEESRTFVGPRELLYHRTHSLYPSFSKNTYDENENTCTIRYPPYYLEATSLLFFDHLIDCRTRDYTRLVPFSASRQAIIQIWTFSHPWSFFQQHNKFNWLLHYAWRVTLDHRNRNTNLEIQCKRLKRNPTNILNLWDTNNFCTRLYS